MPDDLRSRLEYALADGAITRLVIELRAEGHSIADTYRLLYGGFQLRLRTAGRTEEVDRLLAECESVQHALGATFEPELFAKIDGHLRAGTLRQLVVDLHDRDAWSKRQLYDALWAFTFALDGVRRGGEATPIEDELDMLSGWCATGARLWPDEPL